MSDVTIMPATTMSDNPFAISMQEPYLAVLILGIVACLFVIYYTGASSSHDRVD